MLLIFGIKSLCVFVYCGILYAASGMIFSLPVAAAVNIIGTVVMASVPYAIGRKTGNRYRDRLIEKHPKIALLQETGDTNSFFVILLVRIIGILPGDPVSLYFGAAGIPYGKYIAATVIGLLPRIAAFSVMGMSAHDVTSPAFLTAAVFQAVIMSVSAVSYLLICRRKKRLSKDESEN
ncbi:MAG: TVP38/TMEM64 family protein [Eubacteriales bacterium]